MSMFFEQVQSIGYDHLVVHCFFPPYASFSLSCSSRIVLNEHFSTDTNDTGGYQLLDLGADTRVLHVLAERSRVRLSLLQNGLHDRILHHTHDLRNGQQKAFEQLKAVGYLPQDRSGFSPGSAPLSRSPASRTSS